MATSIRKNPGGARSRKKRENLLMKQLRRLEEIQRQEEAARQQEEQRRLEAERAKRREEELRLEELRMQEMLLREMNRVPVRTERRQGKRLWTAEERMAQRVFAAALLESAAAAAHAAGRTGYAEGRIVVLSAGGGKPFRHGTAAAAVKERQPELVAMQGGRLSAPYRGEPPREKRLGTAGVSGQEALSREERGVQPHMFPVVAQLAAAPPGRRRTDWLHDRRMLRGPARSPCMEASEHGSFRNREEEVRAERD